MASLYDAKADLRCLIQAKRRELRILEGIWVACFGAVLDLATAPSARTQGGGGESPADPAGEAGLHEEPTRTPEASASGAAASSTATFPTMFPTSPERVVEERIATWLEEHAAGYEHGGELTAAYALREKAAGIRRREYPPERG